jgi:hypothetical protein
MTKSNRPGRPQPLAVFLLLLVGCLIAGIIISNAIRSSDKSQLGVNTQLTNSSTTDDVELEITSLDDSRLNSSGDYVILARVRGADNVELSRDEVTVDQAALKNNGQWQDVKLRASLTKAGKYQLRLTATSSDPAVVSEKIINLTVPSQLVDKTDKNLTAYVVVGFLALALLVIVIIVRRRSEVATEAAKH